MGKEDPVVAAAKTILYALHPFPDSKDVADTPERMVRALTEMTSGYYDDWGEILKAQFDAGDYDQIVAVAGIRFWSLCEHHVLPFNGTAAVAYLPAEGGPVVGLSKIPRLVQMFARRLQTQERMTQQIAKAMEAGLKPRGVLVMVRAQHACMAARGVGQPDAWMVTSAVSGAFRDSQAARDEALRALGV